MASFLVDEFIRPAHSMVHLNSNRAVQALAFSALFSLLAVSQAAATNSDLIPQSIVVSPNPVAPGASLSVNWTLANIGTAAANATSTTVVRINQSTSSEIGRAHV